MDVVENAQQIVKTQAISALKDYFREPAQILWDEAGIKKLERLVDIAIEFEPSDPLDWIRAFDSSHPHDIEIGSEKTRVGKILGFAEIYRDNKKKGDSRKFRQLYRDFH